MEAFLDWLWRNGRRKAAIDVVDAVGMAASREVKDLLCGSRSGIRGGIVCLAVAKLD